MIRKSVSVPRGNVKDEEKKLKSDNIYTFPMDFEPNGIHTWKRLEVMEGKGESCGEEMIGWGEGYRKIKFENIEGPKIN